MTLRFASLLLVFTYLLPAVARAQVIIHGDDGSITIIGGDEMPTMDEAPAATADGKAPSGPPSPRQEKLQKLEFDRRPSAILSAWSTPPKPPGKPGEAPPAAEAPSESAGNALGGEAGAGLDKARLAGVTSSGVVAIGTGVSTGVAVGVGAAPTGAAVSVASVPAVPVTPSPAGGAVGVGAAPAAGGSPPAAPSASAAATPTPSAQPGGQPGEVAAAAEAAPDPEAVKKKAAEAEAAKKKAEEEAAAKAAEAKAIDAEMEVLKRNVTLGDWTAVKTYLAGLTEDERKAGYERMLLSLQQGPQQKPSVPQQGQPYLEKNRFAPADVVGLAAAAPLKLTKEHLKSLGQLLRQALDAGHQLESFLLEVKPRLEEETPALNRRQLALMLVDANEPLGMEGLLPTAEEAEKENDREGLNLLSRLCLAQFEKDKKVAWLEKAWTATQAVLAVGEVEDEAKTEGLKRAVEIAPKIQKELGQTWLDESFTQRPERGMEILATIGSAASLSLAAEPMEVDKRTKLLELQTTAAKALLAAAPDRAASWKGELALLAGNWLREAQVTYQYDESTSLGPRRQRDYYGNFYYWNNGGQYRGNVPTALRTDKILDIRPSDDWLALIDATLQPRFQMVFAQLLLKVGEEAKAFPYIEGLAATLPKRAKDLVDEFLRVWTKNHDPNSESNRQNQYIFFYGFEERANGIPLTRSKQERNLEELGEWVARLRALPVELDDDLLTTAFTTAHSSAEVYRLETIERIFGRIVELKPATLAELVQKMRTNLVEVWRDPAVQKDKKTNRHQQDIQTEVLRGYELARATVLRAEEDHPESWELCLAQAALEHDENNYRYELKKDPEFSARREASFGTFAKAAALYAAAVEALDQEKETTQAFELWFYAALGACDLRAVDHEKLLAERQIPLIKSALLGLPGERAQRHADMFANTLFTRMSNAAPAVKFRYVRAGLEIVGDNKLASEARQVFDYYGDLVTEIQLRTTIDGSDQVGHLQPFGLHVDLRHTLEIERESGGFSKYLQNQNAQNYGWNYGRPLEDYRDKFEESARETLKEHFEVLSITFNEPEAKSKAEPEYGWRVTPYAYVLLKPRGSQIDRVPPLRLDLDFLDTTGYAILPVESAALPIDATGATGGTTGEASGERPYEKLALTQILDERQAKDGKLLLEVKASSRGLVPELDTALELASIGEGGFDIVQRDDHGVSVVKFDEEGRGVVSERTWTIAMRAKAGLANLPDTFTFGKPRVETVTNEHFRYVDADLASVEPTISLERAYGKPSRKWMWWIPAVLAVGVGAFAGWRRLQRPKAAARSRFQVPDPITPFTVLGLLREIESKNGLAAEELRELGAQIQRLEHHFFVQEQGEAPDLRHIAEEWAGRAR